MRYYFDHNATTPVDADVLSAFLTALSQTHGNASSIHQDGQAARQALETARRQVATLMGAKQPREIVFTSGGTEANNLAILGTVRGSAKADRHVITSAIEHPAVLQPCGQLEREGVAVTYLPVDRRGVVNAADLRAALRPETVLVSVMHVNNEVGTVQPIAELAAVCRDAKVPLHVDGVQAAGKVAIEVDRSGVDLYTISGHKLYAPKGVGALYVRTGHELMPQQWGGRHENGRRAGTENVPSAVALGRAAELAVERLAADTERIARLRDRLEAAVVARVERITINGDVRARAANTSNLCVHGIEGEALVIALDLRGFAISSGAACSSGAVEPSHVLLALGMTKAEAKSCVRISLGRGNDEGQVDALVEALVASVAHLRRLAPSEARSMAHV